MTRQKLDWDKVRNVKERRRSPLIKYFRFLGINWGQNLPQVKVFSVIRKIRNDECIFLLAHTVTVVKLYFLQLTLCEVWVW